MALYSCQNRPIIVGVKYIILVVVAFVIMFSLINTGISVTRSPELLGDSSALLLNVAGSVIGFVWNDYAGFLLYGHMENNRTQCALTHAWGGHFGNYDAYGNPIPDSKIPCLLVWRDAKFRGWIDFRGHERAFCGATSQDKLPDVCMWR